MPSDCVECDYLNNRINGGFCSLINKDVEYAKEKICTKNS